MKARSRSAIAQMRSVIEPMVTPGNSTGSSGWSARRSPRSGADRFAPMAEAREVGMSLMHGLP
jgi:hypothetical protein